MAEPSLFEAITKIVEDERERRRTFGETLSMLREELPPLNVTREQAAAVVDEYDSQELARQIVEGIFPRKI